MNKKTKLSDDKVFMINRDSIIQINILITHYIQEYQTSYRIHEAY